MKTERIFNDRNQGLLGTWLVIDGAGFSVHGGNGFCPFVIYSDTNVGMKQITVTGGGRIFEESWSWGGGIYNDGNLYLSDSTVSGNQASTGGGIYNYGGMYDYKPGTATLINCTVARNIAWAGPTAGGICNKKGQTVLKNSIVAYNGQGDCRDRYHGVRAFSSLIEDSGEDACNLTNGENGNIIGVDPRLGMLANNGGPTWTHALLPQSPAIDKGDNDLAVDADGKPLKTDQRGQGYARIRGNAVDIGAFEAPVYDLRP